MIKGLLTNGSDGLRRALALLLCMAMLVTLLPVSAMAENAQPAESSNIQTLSPMSAEIAVAIGTQKGDIGLPKTLTATLEGGETVAVPVEWSGVYDMDTAGSYRK